MIAQFSFLIALLASANAGIATSYAVGNIGLGGLGGIEEGLGGLRGVLRGGIGGIVGGLEEGLGRGLGELERFGGGLRGGLGELERFGGGLRGGLGLDGIGIGRVGGGILLGRGERTVDLYTPARYEFKYGVGDPKTGDRKEQAEARVGDVVRGEYSLAEPDGTIRVVKYTADDHNGFNAVVSRIGHAAHPQILLRGGGIGEIGLGGGIGIGRIGLGRGI